MLMVVVVNKTKALQSLLLREGTAEIPGGVQIGDCAPECHPLIVTCSQRDYRLAMDEAFKADSGIDHYDGVCSRNQAVDIFVQQENVGASRRRLPCLLLHLRKLPRMQFEHQIAPAQIRPLR